MEEGVASAPQLGELGRGSLGEEVAGCLVWGEGLALNKEDRKGRVSPRSDDFGGADGVVTAADELHGIALESPLDNDEASHGDPAG